MTGTAIALSIRKELRALLPAWVACLMAIGAVVLLRNPFFYPFALISYGVGSLALGAQSMGHEHGYRTVGLLLSQPVDRTRIYLIKLGVLAPLLAIIGVVACLVIVTDVRGFTGLRVVPPRYALLVFLAALFITPWLTMLLRNSIAGLVFTISGAGTIALAGNILWLATDRQVPMETFREPFFWWGMIVASALAAVAGWRRFARLEAIEGRGRELHLPLRAATDADAHTRSARGPYARLIAKELRIHQMAFAVAAFNAFVVIAIVMLRPAFSEFDITVAIPMTFLHMAALPVLIGALASAEERELGTREWQLLMPMAAWKQFAVKAGVAVALSLVLALSVPALTIWLLSARFDSIEWDLLVLLVVVLASVSLYISSLSSGGMRAVVIAMPGLVVAWVAIMWIGQTVWSLLFRDLSRVWPGWRPPRGLRVTTPSGEFLALAVAALVISALVLHYAHLNHRSAERPRTQLRRQAGWITAAVVAEITLLTLAGVR